MPKISIIVPIYNAEKVLKRCVDSILNQSYKNFELILINDGSKDKSIDIINEYKEKDERIKVIDNKNKGVSETRNIGIKTSKGEYIQFIDADDFIDPYMIEETLKEIEKNKADSVITGLYLDIESENEIKSSKQTFEYKIEEGNSNIAVAVMDRLNGTYINSPVNKIYKKSIIIDNNIYMDKTIDLGEDLLFNLEYLKNCKNGVLYKTVYYIYRYRYQKLSDKLRFEIPLNVCGPGLCLVHGGTIIINGNAKIGKNCRIQSMVNIGSNDRDKIEAPVIGDNVFIGPGVKIYGGVKIANNIAIGANAVVNKSFLEESTTIAGVPAKIVSRKGTEDIISLRN